MNRIERQKKYRQTHKVKIAQRKKQYQQSLKGKQTYSKADKKYRKTIIGYLHCCFNDIKQRCNNSKCTKYKYYGGRGIKCLFESSQEFVDYVINELKIDPRGFVIHRVDNNRHYELGNIKFLTKSEHTTLHNLI